MLDLVVLAVFPWLMAFAALSDLMTMTIPNRVSVALIVGFGAAALATGMPLADIGWHVMACVVALVVGYVLFELRWIGGGDAKLAAVVLLWIGPALVVDYVALTGLLGGVLTIALLAFRHFEMPVRLRGRVWLERLQQKASGVPYGVALAGAGLIVYPYSAIWLRTVAQG